MIELAAVGDPAAVPDAVASVLGVIQQPGMTWSRASPRHWRGGRGCSCSTTASTFWTPRPTWSRRSFRTRRPSRSSRPAGKACGRPTNICGRCRHWTPGRIRLRRRGPLRRARRSRGARFALDPVAVVEICRRLDGIPLGIELAASRMVSMTVTEVRDRSMTGSGYWSVAAGAGAPSDSAPRRAVVVRPMDEDERALLNRCSVFAAASTWRARVRWPGSEDEFATLDLLDALVRKSLLVADRSSGHTRFSMLETIRQFAEDQLAADGQAEQTRGAHARYFAGHEADVLALWDSPRQREAYGGSPPSCPICAPLSGGPPTKTTSTPPLPSPNTRDSWDSGRAI